MEGEKHILILSTEHIGEEKPQKFAYTVGATLMWRSLPDNKFDTVPFLDIVQTIEDAVCGNKVDVVFTHHEHDLSIDHRLTYQAVVTAFRGAEVDIYSFEVPCSTGWAFKPFEPNVFVKIDLKKKIEALKIYDSEMRKYPHPRSYGKIKDVERFKLIRKYGL